MRNSPGLYLHVPFCLSKCSYCDFYSVTGTESIPRWLGAVEKEMALYDSFCPEFDTLFIGGGTPSLLDEGDFRALFAALHAHFTLAPDSEVTVEINPDDVGDERLTLFRSLGINRISLGIQSFRDQELTFLGRRHTAEKAAQAIEAAVRAGFSNIALDLIYGLPGQTNSAWIESLERAVSFGPSHISCYQLTAEGETPLNAMVKGGRIRLPSDTKTASLFLATSRLLRSYGFIHYEVSNFAATRDLVCHHNRKYWNHTAYLGLGPAAHSFDGCRRWWNHRSLTRYCGSLGNGKTPVEGMETLSSDQLRMEAVYLGLRTENGVALSELPPSARPFVDRLVRERLAQVNEGTLTLTPKGYLIADSLPAFLTP